MRPELLGALAILASAAIFLFGVGVGLIVGRVARSVTKPKASVEDDDIWPLEGYIQDAVKDHGISWHK